MPDSADAAVRVRELAARLTESKAVRRRGLSRSGMSSLASPGVSVLSGRMRATAPTIQLDAGRDRTRGRFLSGEHLPLARSHGSGRHRELLSELPGRK